MKIRKKNNSENSGYYIPVAAPKGSAGTSLRPSLILTLGSNECFFYFKKVLIYEILNTNQAVNTYSPAVTAGQS